MFNAVAERAAAAGRVTAGGAATATSEATARGAAAGEAMMGRAAAAGGARSSRSSMCNGVTAECFNNLKLQLPLAAQRVISSNLRCPVMLKKYARLTRCINYNRCTATGQ